MNYRFLDTKEEYVEGALGRVLSMLEAIIGFQGHTYFVSLYAVLGPP